MADAIRERLAERKTQINDLRKRDSDEFYQDLAESSVRGTKIAWSSAGLCSSLFDAMGIKPCSPESLSAFCAWRQLSDKFNQAAEARGIPHDVCSYGRLIMGMMWEHDGPFGPLPRPDVIVTDPTYCDAHAKMWEIPGQYYGTPVFNLDGIFLLDGRIGERDLAYRVSEMQRLVAFCEENLGVKLDLDRFKENTRNEARVRALLHEIHTLRKETPCPRSTRDMISEIFYLVLLPFSQKALTYLELVAEDCRERVEHGIGVVENERFRVYYDNIPLWFWLKFFDYMQERGVVFAIDAYSNSYFNGLYFDGQALDEDHPFESLALRHMHNMACSGAQPNLERFARLIEEWRCDGAVVFVNRSCKVVTSGRHEKIEMFNKRFGIPILEFEGEMADATSINKANVLERADVFLEQLETAKAAKGSAAR